MLLEKEYSTVQPSKYIVSRTNEKANGGIIVIDNKNWTATMTPEHVHKLEELLLSFEKNERTESDEQEPDDRMSPS